MGVFRVFFQVVAMATYTSESDPDKAIMQSGRFGSLQTVEVNCTVDISAKNDLLQLSLRDEENPSVVVTFYFKDGSCTTSFNLGSCIHAGNQYTVTLVVDIPNGQERCFNCTEKFYRGKFWHEQTRKCVKGYISELGSPDSSKTLEITLGIVIPLIFICLVAIIMYLCSEAKRKENHKYACIQDLYRRAVNRMGARMSNEGRLDQDGGNSGTGPMGAMESNVQVHPTQRSVSHHLHQSQPAGAAVSGQDQGSEENHATEDNISVRSTLFVSNISRASTLQSTSADDYGTD